MMKYFASLFALSVLFAGVMVGQIAKFDFPATNSLVVSSKDVNVTVSNMSLSNGTIETNITTGSYFPNEPYIEETGGWTATNQDSAKCFTFTITANSGYTFSITNISFSAYATAAGPSAFSAEVDGSSIAAVDAPNGSLVSYNKSVSKSGLSSAVIKIQGWLNGSRSSAGTGAFRLDDVVISGTVTSSGSPTLITDPASISSFSYVEGSGPSTSQSYNLSGTNLTGAPGNITVNGSTNYEVSDDDITFSSSVSVPYSSATLGATAIYVRLKAGLSAGNYSGETISNSGGGASTQNVTANGSVYKTEPTNHATSFSSAAGSPSYSAINLSWTDASGGVVPDGYLIKGSATSFAAIADPVDGTAESDGALVKNVAQGTEAASIGALDASTTYYFKIYPYTNSSSNINYKTDGTIPTTSLKTDDAPPATLLLEENFDYVANDDDYITYVTSNWAIHSGTQPPRYKSAGLSYADYPSSNIGGALWFTKGSNGNSDGDINMKFDSITTTSNIFVSFLLNLDSAQSTADYFFNLGPRTIGSNFRGRVFARSNVAGWSLGLSKSSETRVDDNTVLDFNKAYLVVLKYSFNTATASDDEVTLYLYSSGVPSAEYGSPLVKIGPTGAGTTGDITSVGSVVVRQGLNTPTGKIDGIRVSTSWSQAPLPVELTSFTAMVKGKNVELLWKTATETQNAGFEIERSDVREGKSGAWRKIGFAEGAGTISTPKSYSYVDAGARGAVQYRLKQIDRDGGFHYSNSVNAVVQSIPQEYALIQNYPNPFNPTTQISYQLPVSGNVTLRVYNILGEEVALLVNGMQSAGEHTAQFDAAKLPSGIYFYTLQTAQFTKTMKMLLVK